MEIIDIKSEKQKNRVSRALKRIGNLRAVKKARKILSNPKGRTAVIVFAVMIVGAGTVFFARAASPPQTETESWQRVAASGDGCIKPLEDLTASEGRAIEFTCSAAPPNTGDHENHNAENCTPGIGRLGSMGPCINNALIPAALPGKSTTSIARINPVRTSPPMYYNDNVFDGEPAAFRTRCDYSHMNFDDPVLYYNQPNKAHLHTYFGNTGARANSTSQSLLSSGNSTCSGGILNRSAYWIPSMIDTANGRPVAPNDDRSNAQSDLEIYYKLGYQGVGYDDVVPFPNGLQMIAGNPANATTRPALARNGEYPTTYYCEGPGPQDRTRQDEGQAIPVCTSGEVLVMTIDFPQCWDGVNLRSANGRSHVAYGRGYRTSTNEPVPNTPISEDRGCPPSHPVPMPHVEMFVRWRVPQGSDTRNWRLSSDNYTNGPGGYSGHADYVFAWNADIFPTIINRCYKARQDCGYQFGDGREPNAVREPWWSRR